MVKTLFQASTWNALALGNFDTVISVRELLRCADTGVGIGTALDGVITFENGAAYKTAPDGEVTVMRPEDSMAFAAAMVFDENAPEIALNGIDDLTSLKQMLAPFVLTCLERASGFRIAITGFYFISFPISFI